MVKIDQIEENSHTNDVKYAIRSGCLMLILKQKMRILNIYLIIKINSMTRNADSIKKV